MKKILLVAGALVLGQAVGFAQQQQIHRNRAKTEIRQSTPKQIAERKVERIDRAVQLDEIQKEQLRAIYQRRAERDRDRATLNRKEMEEIKSVLTPAQQEKLNVQMKERAEKMRERKHQRGKQ